VIGQLGRVLLLVGLAMAALGLVLILAGRLGLGRLPGDIVWRGEGWTVYVPLGWMILLSVLLTVLLNLFSRR
jgi:hypothetical protein